MAQLGDGRAVMDLRSVGTDQVPVPGNTSSWEFNPKGEVPFQIWRNFYWAKSVSASNKLLIPMYWFKSKVYGRDISRF